jgi:hypothetical protein
VPRRVVARPRVARRGFLVDGTSCLLLGRACY